MVNKQIAAAVLGISVVAGIGTGIVADALTTNSPATRDEVTPTRTPPGPADLIIAPGAVGPVAVGMSKTEAVATGLLDADVPASVDGCPTVPLAWKPAFGDVLDVQTVGNGEIMAIGVRAEGPMTKDGLGVGSTVADVQRIVEDDTPVEAGYGQSGLYDVDSQTGRWIGYLFDAPADEVDGSDRVTFVEVTKGAQPSLMRDGC